MTNQERLEYWRERLSSYVPGQIGVIEWCRANHVGVKSFYRWQRRLQEAGLASGSTDDDVRRAKPQATQKTTTSPGWLAVPKEIPVVRPGAVPVGASSSGVVIRIGEATMELAVGFHAGTLSAAVRNLKEASAC